MTTKLTKKELCVRLKAEIKADTEAIQANKAERATLKATNRAELDARKAAGETAPAVSAHDINSLHELHLWKRRPAARMRLLAYGYLRGKTYHQLEAKAEVPPPIGSGESERYGYHRVGITDHLWDWDAGNDLHFQVEKWVEAGDKTRFDLAPSDFEPVPETAYAVGPIELPKKPGLIDRLRAAVGV